MNEAASGFSRSFNHEKIHGTSSLSVWYVILIYCAILVEPTIMFLFSSISINWLMISANMAELTVVSKKLFSKFSAYTIDISSVF